MSFKSEATLNLSLTDSASSTRSRSAEASRTEATQEVLNTSTLNTRETNGTGNWYEDPGSQRTESLQSPADNVDGRFSFTRTPQDKGVAGSDGVVMTKYSRTQESSQSPFRKKVVSGIDMDDMCYNMNHTHRGIFVIINNFQFLKKPERYGADKDAHNLRRTFKKLGFDVRCYDNLTKAEMSKLMMDVSIHDHTDKDCFGLAILTHGEENGVVYGVDGPIKLALLLEHLKCHRCPTLVGKPKVIFIQACRGYKLDDGTDGTCTKNPSVSYYVPNEGRADILQVEADVLCAYSTPAGYFSFRNTTTGSAFVCYLCEALDLHGEQTDLLTVLTYVNQRMSEEFLSRSRTQPEYHAKKQIPSVVSQLTKLLYFRRKTWTV